MEGRQAANAIHSIVPREQGHGLEVEGYRAIYSSVFGAKILYSSLFKPLSYWLGSGIAFSIKILVPVALPARFSISGMAHDPSISMPGSIPFDGVRCVSYLPGPPTTCTLSSMSRLKGLRFNKILVTPNPVPQGGHTEWIVCSAGATTTATDWIDNSDPHQAIPILSGSSERQLQVV
ncbi:hypothetical protein GX50_02603 [[Emmonsia] crescens]|uniref:Uncharacterized protein n=1 Tax=[Emmonsia] crescens TaxID=73230 RepID=A0A2B7ZMI6_9EURO|nr:hypothetical protein GX50_02603 [Emmonsia crescens]